MLILEIIVIFLLVSVFMRFVRKDVEKKYAQQRERERKRTYSRWR